MSFLSSLLSLFPRSLSECKIRWCLASCLHITPNYNDTLTHTVATCVSCLRTLMENLSAPQEGITATRWALTLTVYQKYTQRPTVQSQTYTPHTASMLALSFAHLYIFYFQYCAAHSFSSIHKDTQLILITFSAVHKNMKDLWEGSNLL